MTSYKQLHTNDEFLDFMEELYFPSDTEIEEIKLPPLHYISATGKGSPGSPEFQEAIRALYGVAYRIKMGLKFDKIVKPVGYFDFKVPPLEGIWGWEDGSYFDASNKDNWEWQLMIMMPAFVSQNLFDQAVEQAKENHPDIPYDMVSLTRVAEGEAIQTTHIGPYKTEPRTVEKLVDYAKTHHYTIAGKHHEIYMGDPRRTSPEKLKTVLRYPVKA